MADHKSAKKAIRKIATRNATSSSRRSKIRTNIKKIEGLIGASKAKEAKALLPTVQAEIMRGVSKGVIKQNTAARKVSQIALKIKNLSGTATKVAS